MDSWHTPIWRMLASLLVLLSATGCGSARYKMMTPDMKPAAARPAVEVKAEAQGVELAVIGLIVYDGAGAWKQKAYWDEYVVRLTNRGTESVVVDAVTLGDVLERNVAAGTDPWALDKAGRNHEKFLQKKGAQANAEGSAHRRRHESERTGVTILVAATLVAPPAMAVVDSAVLIGVTAAAPFYALGAMFVNPKNREIVLTEFNRRRLVLPARLEPGASVAGSVFFPLTPGPETISARTSGGACISVSLAGLEDLHFLETPDKEALKAALRNKTYPLGTAKKLPKRQI